MARVALVTGGQRGIGAAISEALKAAGRTVVANYAGNDAAAQAFRTLFLLGALCLTISLVTLLFMEERPLETKRPV